MCPRKVPLHSVMSLGFPRASYHFLYYTFLVCNKAFQFLGGIVLHRNHCFTLLTTQFHYVVHETLITIHSPLYIRCPPSTTLIFSFQCPRFVNTRASSPLTFSSTTFNYPEILVVLSPPAPCF